MRRTLALVNGVSGADRAAAEDLAEDAPDGHDAVARELEDRAARVAFLPDLADPQADGRADRELVADLERAEVDAARRQVLRVRARSEARAVKLPEPGLLGFDVLDHEQRDLAMAEAPVGVAGDALAGDDLGRRGRRLELALLETDVDGDDPRPARLRRRGHGRLRKTPLLPPLLKSRRRRTISAPRST